MEEDVDKFLGEYEILCTKYGMHIGACGCCDSPWVTRQDDLGWDLDVHLIHLKEQE